MTDRNCMLNVILATTLWFATRAGLHWHFGCGELTLAESQTRLGTRAVRVELGKNH